MTTELAQKLNPELLELFRDSTLGLYLDGHEDAIFALGTVNFLAPGGALDSHGILPLHVVLDGRLTAPDGWYGPGNHFEANGQPMTAIDLPARVWTIDLRSQALVAPENRMLKRRLTQALLAADAAEAFATPPENLPDPETLCDVDHPEIRRRAARLRRASPASTAEAILQFVQPFPYRFGAWQERASDTLARGVGMCTTKSNLQVALLRASGLEAGFVELPMPTAVLGKLMPSGWVALQRPVVKHYYAAVKLGGVWHGCDSSYDSASSRIYLESYPWMAHRENPVLSEGAPYIPALEYQNKDLFDIEVFPSLATEMGKKSRFLTRHFESLNTRVDRLRGTHLQWGKAALRAAENDEREVRA